MKRRYYIAALAMAGILGITGCAGTTSAAANTTVTSTSTTSSGDIASLDTEDLFSNRDMDTDYDESECVKINLSDNSSTCDSDDVTIDGQTITITGEGTYLISGSLSNGSIVVNTDKSEKVQLILDNVSISNDSGAGIYVKQADKVFVTLAEGSTNQIVSTAFEADGDTNIDGAIFAKDDLTLNGTGSLEITSAAHGIVCKDDLVVTGGTYTITSEKQGLSGKQSVRIADGTFTIESGGDAIHSEDSDDDTLGFVYIADGEFHLTATGDGISSSYVTQIDGGTYDITTGGGSANASTNNTQTSAKGIKSGNTVIINDGTFTVVSSDDSIHSNNDVAIYGGTLTLDSGDDGIHADSETLIVDGTVTIETSYEGIEGQSVEIQGGTIDVVSSDDGINAAGGSDQSSMNRPGANDFAADEDCVIVISGGEINIDATGDGIDSNGDLTVSGGTIYVTGSSDNGNGALDYDGTATISGGTVIAAGMSGMAQNFGDDSTQGSMLINLDSNQTGEIVLKDSDGNEVASYTPGREYNSVVISCADLKEGETYTLVTGSTSTEVTLDSLVYSNGGQSNAPGQGGPGQNGSDQNGPGQNNSEDSGQAPQAPDQNGSNNDSSGNGGPGQGNPPQGRPGQNSSDNGSSQGDSQKNNSSESTASGSDA